MDTLAADGSGAADRESTGVSRTPMCADAPESRPLRIDLNRTRELRVTWSDGRESVYPLALLRQACPCAACRDRRNTETRQQGTTLPILPGASRVDDMVTAVAAELVGNYALRIRWRDGHDTGIFDFGLLRSLDTAADGGMGS